LERFGAGVRLRCARERADIMAFLGWVYETGWAGVWAGVWAVSLWCEGGVGQLTRSLNRARIVCVDHDLHLKSKVSAQLQSTPASTEWKSTVGREGLQPLKAYLYMGTTKRLNKDRRTK
jgi:hypothetical protein